MLRADAGVQRVQRTPRECKASGTTLGAPLTNPHVSRAAEAAHNPTYSLPHLRLFCCCAVSLTLFLFPGVHPRADKPLRTRQKVPGVTGQVQQLSALSGSGLKFWHCLETWAHQTFTDPTCWEHTRALQILEPQIYQMQRPRKWVQVSTRMRYLHSYP